MLTNLKSQADVDRFQELLNLDVDDLTISQAENLVRDVYNMLEADDKRVFASEWARMVAAALPAAATSVRANSAADVAMIAYAQRFYK